MIETCLFYVVYLDSRKPGRFSYVGLDKVFLYEPFYVGKGKNNRHLDHLYLALRMKKNYIKF